MMVSFTCNLCALHCAFANVTLRRGFYCLWNALALPVCSPELSLAWKLSHQQMAVPCHSALRPVNLTCLGDR